MTKVLLISGSPRKGNTEFILEEIKKGITPDLRAELILLRNFDINHCRGCLSCHKKPRCVLKDDMRVILDKMLKSDLYLIGTPNYFDSVSGITKNFIDRTHPFYKERLLKGRKLISVVVGGGKIANSKRVADHDLTYFASTHGIENIGAYCFQGLFTDSVMKNSKQKKKIEKIIKRIRLVS